MSKETLREYFIITIGSILVAIGVQFFLFPSNLAAGGVSGLAIILEKLIPILTKSTYVILLNILLFVIGFIFLGNSFGTKTIYSSAVLSGSLWIFEFLFKNFSFTNNLFLNTFYGTLITAIGMAMVFNEEASTGGTDIIAKILNKYFKIDIGKSLMATDFVVTVLCFFLFGAETALFAILSVLMNGPLIDRIIDGLKTAKEIMIISLQHELIANFILTDLDRTCTMLEGFGGYTKQGVKVIYVVLNRSDYIRLREYIKNVDKKAFVSVNEVREVIGEGYQDISLL